jgi:tetratricopeptide (TPR) repeat protein
LASDSAPNLYHNLIGDLYCVIQDYDKAATYYLRHIEASDHRLIGDVFSKVKKYEQAEQSYLLAIENGDGKALESLGFVYYDQKKYYLALTTFESAVSQNPEKFYCLIADMYRLLKNYEQAEKYFLMSIEYGGTDSYRFLVYMLIEDELKRFTDAEKYCLSAISQNNIECHLAYSKLLDKTGRLKESEEQKAIYTQKKKTAVSPAK